MGLPPTGRQGLAIFGVSLVAWFIPDTVFSIISGFWENAVQNFVFAVLFAIPLVALYCQARRAQRPSDLEA